MEEKSDEEWVLDLQDIAELHDLHDLQELQDLQDHQNLSWIPLNCEVRIAAWAFITYASIRCILGGIRPP